MQFFNISHTIKLLRGNCKNEYNCDLNDCIFSFITSTGALRTFFYSLISAADKDLIQIDKIKRRPFAGLFLSTNLQILF